MALVVNTTQDLIGSEWGRRPLHASMHIFPQRKYDAIADRWNVAKNNVCAYESCHDNNANFIKFRQDHVVRCCMLVRCSSSLARFKSKRVPCHLFTKSVETTGTFQKRLFLCLEKNVFHLQKPRKFQKSKLYTVKEKKKKVRQGVFLQRNNRIK